MPSDGLAGGGPAPHRCASPTGPAGVADPPCAGAGPAPRPVEAGSRAPGAGAIPPQKLCLMPNSQPVTLLPAAIAGLASDAEDTARPRFASRSLSTRDTVA